jgi:hypothetical protein
VTAGDIGVLQQLEIFEYLRELQGITPPVLEASAFLKAPEAQLRALCARLGIGFTPRMLRWPPGSRRTDGVWAPHWYDAVLRSTEFEPYRERDRRVPPEFRGIIDAVMPAYETLAAHRLG